MTEFFFRHLKEYKMPSLFTIKMLKFHQDSTPLAKNNPEMIAYFKIYLFPNHALKLTGTT